MFLPPYIFLIKIYLTLMLPSTCPIGCWIRRSAFFIHRRGALVDENQRIALKTLEKACRRINRK